MSLNFGCCAPAFGKQMTATAFANQNLASQNMASPKFQASPATMGVIPHSASVPSLKFQGSIVADALFHNAENHNAVPKFGRFLEGLRVPEGLNVMKPSMNPFSANGRVNYLA
ncbi:MAG: hypothetical protein VKJ04_05620 [Vampirovibrionales bacterium]|nr:hypothetical protein [Vampirovibrionales bacterium]